MDCAALPPEINSTRMYAGAGSGPMWTAASVWEGLGAKLSSAAAAYRAVVSGLTRETWRGWSTETLRDEINDLRKQLTDMAMERDVLMRSLSLWARGSLEE
jgi:hypothetical protein